MSPIEHWTVRTPDAAVRGSTSTSTGTGTSTGASAGASASTSTSTSTSNTSYPDVYAEPTIHPHWGVTSQKVNLSSGSGRDLQSRGVQHSNRVM